MNDFFNHTINRISKGVRGLADHVNDIADEIALGLDKLPGEEALKQGSINYALDTGVADAYVIALAYAPLLKDGLSIEFKALNANTGPSTVHVNELGIKALVHADGSALRAEDIRDGQIVTAKYNDIDFRVLSSLPAALEDAIDAVDVSQAHAAAAEQSALDALNTSLAVGSVVNFKGRWSDLTSALAVPAVTYHANRYWQLLNNLADVTTAEPSVTNDWSVLGEHRTAIKSADYTAKIGDSIPVDMSVNAWALTLPLAVFDSRVSFSLSAGDLSINNLLINTTGGQSIMGDSSLNIDQQIYSLEFWYNGIEWRIA